ncbi:MAG: permease, partial [Propylenella sp.]
MASVIAQPYGKRFVLALLLVSALAAYFWTQSRYPSLDEKAMMSGAIQLEDTISFEAMLPILPEYPLWKKIVYSTANWIKTNKQGMTFAVFFAAAFLTMLGYMQRRSFKNGFANSFMGLFIGAPLGVCVNCAAPIAKGLYKGGARAESSLSMMIASPTLNIVVLTIALSIMPFYMVVMKVGLSLSVILVAVPIICRFLPEGQLQVPEARREAVILPSVSDPPIGENAIWALVRFLGDYAVNLWFIVWTTVPLMFVAGFLGAVVATLLPAELLAQASFGVVGLVLASIVGTFLPLPIGLDVVASGALLGGGVAHGYVMALLFTLGSFSVYSFFIVASSISLRAAWLLAGVICAFGIVAGVAAHAYQGWQTKRALDMLTGFGFSLVGSAQAAEAEPFGTVPDDANVLTITREPFDARSPAGEKPFTRMEAWHLGIDQPVEFSFGDMWPPFWEGRGISASDYDRDGDIDVAIASTEHGLYLYANDGSGKFSRVEFPLGEIEDLPVFNAGFVDVNNDGWPDLFLTTYQAGNYLLRNDAGRFDAANLTEVKNRDDAV